MNKFLVIGVVAIVICSVVLYGYYATPVLIGEDFDCDSERGQTGIPYKRRPLPLESSQHYINRINEAFQNQIKEACD